MIGSILQDCKFLLVENDVAASQATTVGEIIDTAGFGGACFIYKLGTVVDAAAITLTIYQGSDATVSDVAALSGATGVIATTSSDGDKLIVVDVKKPRERYLRPTIVSATQDVTIDSAICILYNPDVLPVTQTSFVDTSTQVVSPAES